jgi:hypothetical protein
VEEHISTVAKESLKSKNRLRQTLDVMKPDINGTMKIPLKGLKNKLSLQASVPYDTVQKEQRLESRLNTLKILGQDKHFLATSQDKRGHSMRIVEDSRDQLFLAGGRSKLLQNTAASLNAGEPYTDPWMNPFNRRGERHPAPNVSNIPFVSAVGGNKSTALPNNIFDVIADAEETGGSVKRHLGKSSRFGVPNNSDCRDVLPKPPSSTASTFQSFTRTTDSRYTDLV